MKKRKNLPKKISPESKKAWKWYTKKKNFKKHLMSKQQVKQLKKLLK